METTNLIVGSIVGLTFGALAFLVKRLIAQNDAFQADTKKKFQSLNQTTNANYQAIQELRVNLKSTQTLEKLNEIQEAMKVGVPVVKLDKMSKNYLVSIINHVRSIEETLEKEKEKRREDHGTVVWLKEEMESTNKKLVGLHKTLDVLAKKSTGPKKR